MRNGGDGNVPSSQQSRLSRGIPTLLISPSSVDIEEAERRFPRRTIQILSILHVIFGVVSIASEITFSVIPPHVTFYLIGVWFGLVFVMAGIIGFLTARRVEERRLIKAFLVVSSVASIGGICILIVQLSFIRFLVTNDGCESCGTATIISIILSATVTCELLCGILSTVTGCCITWSKERRNPYAPRIPD